MNFIKSLVLRLFSKAAISSTAFPKEVVTRSFSIRNIGTLTFYKE